MIINKLDPNFNEDSKEGMDFAGIGDTKPPNLPETENAMRKYAVSHATTPEDGFVRFMNMMEKDRNYWRSRCILAQDHINHLCLR